MRIAIVSDAAYPFTKGGSEKPYHALALQLAEWGHHVDWYTMQYWVGERLLLRDGIRYVGVCRQLPFYSGSRRSIREAVLFGLACLRLLGRAERYDVVDCSQHPFFSVPVMGLVAKRWRAALVVQPGDEIAKGIRGDRDAFFRCAGKLNVRFIQLCRGRCGECVRQRR